MRKTTRKTQIKHTRRTKAIMKFNIYGTKSKNSEMLFIYGYRRRRRRWIHFYQIYELNPPNFSNFNLLFMKEFSFLVHDIFCSFAFDLINRKMTNAASQFLEWNSKCIIINSTEMVCINLLIFDGDVNATESILTFGPLTRWRCILCVTRS